MFLHNREELQNLRKEAEKRLHARSFASWSVQEPDVLPAAPRKFMTR